MNASKPQCDICESGKPGKTKNTRKPLEALKSISRCKNMLSKLKKSIRRFRNRKYEKEHLANLESLTKNEALLRQFLVLLKQQAEKFNPMDERFYEAMNYIINPIRRIVFQKRDLEKVFTIEYLNCEDEVDFHNFNTSWREKESQILDNLESYMNFILQGPNDDHDDYDDDTSHYEDDYDYRMDYNDDLD
jgi:hypothetical protein